MFHGSTQVNPVAESCQQQRSFLGFGGASLQYLVTLLQQYQSPIQISTLLTSWRTKWLGQSMSRKSDQFVELPFSCGNLIVPSPWRGCNDANFLTFPAKLPSSRDPTLPELKRVEATAAHLACALSPLLTWVVHEMAKLYKIRKQFINCNQWTNWT